MIYNSFVYLCTNVIFLIDFMSIFALATKSVLPWFLKDLCAILIAFWATPIHFLF